MPAFEDLTGLRFGRLTVLERVKKDHDVRTYWRCKCDCGNEIVTDAVRLKNGDTKSCGCYRSENTSKFNAETKTTHGKRNTVLYGRWRSMKNRVKNEYKNFPDRYVCDEWRISFEAFEDWALKNGYKPELSLDRIDNNGPYSPDNCRWVDMSVQVNNRSTNRYLEYNGKTLTVAQFAKEIGMNDKTVLSRLNKGMTPDEIAKTPINKKERIIHYNGCDYNINDWGVATGLGSTLIYSRLNHGWDEIRAITTPPVVGGINAIYFVDDNGKPIREE